MDKSKQKKNSAEAFFGFMSLFNGKGAT